MTDRELAALTSRFDFERLKEVSDRQAVGFHDGVGTRISMSLVPLFNARQPAKKKVDDQHVLKEYKSTLPNCRLEVICRKVALTYGYTYAYMAYHIVLDRAEWKFDCLNDTGSSSVTLNKLSVLNEHAEMLKSLKMIERM